MYVVVVLELVADRDEARDDEDLLAPSKNTGLETSPATGLGRPRRQRLLLRARFAAAFAGSRSY